MLGSEVYKEKGRVTSRRVLPHEGSGLRSELTYEAEATILGIPAAQLGTYWTELQSGGFVYGEGRGIITTHDGAVAEWIGSGRGRPTAEGGASFRGVLYLQSNAEALARVNGLTVILEHESDRDGNIETTGYEWV